MAVRCCQGDGDIEPSYDPTFEPRQSDASRETEGDRDIELSYDPTQEPTQSDAARETGTLSCPTTQSRSRGVGWHMLSISSQLVLGTRQPIANSMQPGRRGIELSHDPTQEPRGGSQMLPGRRGQ